MNIIELAKQAGLQTDSAGVWVDDGYINDQLEAFAELVRADEREFIAEKWEKWYGYDKHGVAEFIRKRANTQGEQT